MEFYLLTYCLYDGAHEHYEHITIRAKSEEDAQERGHTQDHNVGDSEYDHPTMWNYDGSTSAILSNWKRITKGQMKTLDELGVANFYLL